MNRGRGRARGRGASRGAVRCFTCKKEGHAAKDCTSKRKCLHCKKDDHKSYECTEKNMCYKCGKEGHRATDCGDGNFCLFCRKNGHKLKDCKNASKCKQCGKPLTDGKHYCKKTALKRSKSTGDLSINVREKPTRKYNVERGLRRQVAIVFKNGNVRTVALYNHEKEYEEEDHIRTKVTDLCPVEADIPDRLITINGADMRIWKKTETVDPVNIVSLSEVLSKDEENRVLVTEITTQGSVGTGVALMEKCYGVDRYFMYTVDHVAIGPALVTGHTCKGLRTEKGEFKASGKLARAEVKKFDTKLVAGRFDKTKKTVIRTQRGEIVAVYDDGEFIAGGIKPGDSGSPMLQKDGDDWVVVALVERCTDTRVYVVFLLTLPDGEVMKDAPSSSKEVSRVSVVCRKENNQKPTRRSPSVKMKIKSQRIEESRVRTPLYKVFLPRPHLVLLFLAAFVCVCGAIPHDAVINEREICYDTHKNNGTFKTCHPNCLKDNSCEHLRRFGDGVLLYKKPCMEGWEETGYGCFFRGTHFENKQYKIHISHHSTTYETKVEVWFAIGTLFSLLGMVIAYNSYKANRTAKALAMVLLRLNSVSADMVKVEPPCLTELGDALLENGLCNYNVTPTNWTEQKCAMHLKVGESFNDSGYYRSWDSGALMEDLPGGCERFGSPSMMVYKVPERFGLPVYRLMNGKRINVDKEKWDLYSCVVEYSKDRLYQSGEGMISSCAHFGVGPRQRPTVKVEQPKQRICEKKPSFLVMVAVAASLFLLLMRHQIAKLLVHFRILFTMYCLCRASLVGALELKCKGQSYVLQDRLTTTTYAEKAQYLVGPWARTVIGQRKIANTYGSGLSWTSNEDYSLPSITGSTCVYYDKTRSSTAVSSPVNRALHPGGTKFYTHDSTQSSHEWFDFTSQVGRYSFAKDSCIGTSCNAYSDGGQCPTSSSLGYEWKGRTFWQQSVISYEKKWSRFFVQIQQETKLKINNTWLTVGGWNTKCGTTWTVASLSPAFLIKNYDGDVYPLSSPLIPCSDYVLLKVINGLTTKVVDVPCFRHASTTNFHGQGTSTIQYPEQFSNIYEFEGRAVKVIDEGVTLDVVSKEMVIADGDAATGYLADCANNVTSELIKGDTLTLELEWWRTEVGTFRVDLNDVPHAIVCAHRCVLSTTVETENITLSCGGVKKALRPRLVFHKMQFSRVGEVSAELPLRHDGTAPKAIKATGIGAFFKSFGEVLSNMFSSLAGFMRFLTHPFTLVLIGVVFILVWMFVCRPKPKKVAMKGRVWFVKIVGKQSKWYGGVSIYYMFYMKSNSPTYMIDPTSYGHPRRTEGRVPLFFRLYFRLRRFWPLAWIEIACVDSEGFLSDIGPGSFGVKAKQMRIRRDDAGDSLRSIVEEIYKNIASAQANLKEQPEERIALQTEF